ncbi:response regulator [Elizabethkingia ursingii]|uniref:response regulator n=1 Tax=Elizabethkingia ursingii TaxID=1756150 RepID=UPI0020129183|nr:response regulator [Elizabethkingia ursingii]MCL1669752.1 response regulator [Elizabethkingia ursingii]
MFRKILIAEDHESANLSVQKTLEDYPASATDFVYYCDDALDRIEKSVQLKDPYDLLITDLSFEEDQNIQRIKSGFELITLAKSVAPDLAVIVFSAEKRAGIIDSLFKDYSVDAYIHKGRTDVKELRLAIDAIYNGKKYLSTDSQQSLKEINSFEFSSFDVKVISLLAEGILQKNIPIYLQQENISPSSLSSVEKRLNILKDQLQVNNNEQLVAFCKDLGII